MIGDLVAEALGHLIPSPEGRAGLVLAWLTAGGLAAASVYTFLNRVPRAPEACAAAATALVCLLVMGPVLHKRWGGPGVS